MNQQYDQQQQQQQPYGTGNPSVDDTNDDDFDQLSDDQKAEKQKLCVPPGSSAQLDPPARAGVSFLES